MNSVVNAVRAAPAFVLTVFKNTSTHPLTYVALAGAAYRFANSLFRTLQTEPRKSPSTTVEGEDPKEGAAITSSKKQWAARFMSLDTETQVAKYARVVVPAALVVGAAFLGYRGQLWTLPEALKSRVACLNVSWL